MTTPRPPNRLLAVAMLLYCTTHALGTEFGSLWARRKNLDIAETLASCAQTTRPPSSIPMQAYKQPLDRRARAFGPHIQACCDLRHPCSSVFARCPYCRPSYSMHRCASHSDPAQHLQSPARFGCPHLIASARGHCTGTRFWQLPCGATSAEALNVAGGRPKWRAGHA